MVLLIAQQDVVEERTLAGEEGASNVEGLDVPVLLFEFLFLLYLWLHESLSLLHNESHLSRHAEVRHYQ